MKARFTASTIFILFHFGALSALAQSHPPKHKPSGPYTFEVNAEEVVLNCTVLDSKGQLVNGLDKSNFKVAEDGIPQTIISIQHQDTPVSIGLLVDNSGSMRPKRAAVASAALDLVKASNPGDETFVINFSDQAYLDQDFTSDLGRLQNGLAHLSLSGGTALYDTIVTAADKMEQSAKRPRRVLIVITDGEDNASRLSLDQAIRRVQDMQGPIIYSIGLLFTGNSSGGDKRRARHALEALASQTGGIAFFPPRSRMSMRSPLKSPAIFAISTSSPIAPREPPPPAITRSRCKREHQGAASSLSTREPVTTLSNLRSPAQRRTRNDRYQHWRARLCQVRHVPAIRLTEGIREVAAAQKTTSERLPFGTQASVVDNAWLSAH